MDNDSILKNIKEAGFEDTNELVQHLLCFVSALVPKALASLLTSFTLMTAGPEKVGSTQVLWLYSRIVPLSQMPMEN